MSITYECTNEECCCEFTITDYTDFEKEYSDSDGYITQYEYRGSYPCPECNYENEICVLIDEVIETGEIIRISIL